MRFLLLVIALSSSYFVEWIPNNAATPPESNAASSSPGEFPWQLSGG